MPVSPESAEQRKRRFSYAERYAVWLCHGPKCSWCHDPLRLIETTIDHQIPESLLYDDARRESVFTEYGLPKDFNINGYENWLPCHNHCNQAKGSRTSEFVPGIKKILDRLREKAQVVERVADSVALNIAKDKVFKTLFAALEKQTITVIDLDQLLEAFVRDPAKGGVPDDVIILDSGRWVKRENIVHEGTCRCERQACVGRKNKVYSYFEAGLSPWVVNKGLFWRCYDEFITCPRCSRKHKRGHIGSNDVCGTPYLNQELQSDDAVKA
jgi:HNH endonuclease